MAPTSPHLGPPRQTQAKRSQEAPGKLREASRESPGLAFERQRSCHLFLGGLTGSGDGRCATRIGGGGTFVVGRSTALGLSLALL
eukprot:4734982-Pyramimonas_sp.AAC.1